MAADSFIKQQYWINRDLGMYDEFWRGKAEGTVSLKRQDGSEMAVQALFFPTKESVFRFMNNELEDIARINFHSKVYLDGISQVAPGTATKITGIYNRYAQEYWLHIDSEQPQTFVFGQRNNMWFGVNDFRFDIFTNRHNEIFGHRNFETYQLEKGFTVNGSPVIFEVLAAAAPEQEADKEYIRIRVNSPEGQKPTRIEFYKEKNGTLQCFLDPSQGPLYLKNYRGYEQFIGRILASVNSNRPRLQGRLVLFKIIHNLASEFRIIDVSLQYKKLK